MVHNPVPLLSLTKIIVCASLSAAFTRSYYKMKSLEICSSSTPISGALVLSCASSIESTTWDDSNAESQFGTKSYWDEMYDGMGDFSSDEYSWYYGWGELKSYFVEYAPQPLKKSSSMKRPLNGEEKIKLTEEPKVLVPGIGNDGILLDLYAYGYTDIVAFDYSQSAIDRQTDLLSYNQKALEDIHVLVQDARELNKDWTANYDLVFEKGALDAIYLSGEGNVDLAVRELARVVKKGGIFISVSGVVPEELRRELMNTDEWEWIRDGSQDLKAGCFVWRRL